MKRADKWLRENAVEEARVRGDDFVLQQFESEDPTKLPPATKDSMNDYLFGEVAQEAPPDYSGMTVRNLTAEAKKRTLKGYSGKKKADLVEMLLKDDQRKKPTPPVSPTETGKEAKAAEPETPADRAVATREIKAEERAEGQADSEAKQPWEMTKDNFADTYARPSLKMKDGTILTAPRSHLDIITHQEKYSYDDVAESGWSYGGIYVGESKMKAETTGKVIGWPEAHKAIIRRALTEGKTVPPEILADYPDLVSQPAAVEEAVNDQWQETARGRSIYKADLAKENAKDEYVRGKLTSALSFQKLLAAAVRFQVSLQGKTAKQHATEQYERQPWELLTVHAGIMNAKSARAKTLVALTNAVYAETGLPRKPEGKFRGEDNLDWDAIEPTAAVSKAQEGTETAKPKTKLQQATEELKDATEELKRSFKSPMGIMPDPKRDAEALDRQVKAAVRFVRAAAKVGTLKFRAFLEEVAKAIGQAATDRMRPVLESEWEKFRKTGEVPGMEAISPQHPEQQAEKPKDHIATTDTLIDDWLADRQDSEQDADSRAARHQDELQQIIGKRSAGETVAEAFKGTPHQRRRAVDEAMHLYIDLKDAEQQGFGTPAEQMAKYENKLSNAQKNIFTRSQSLPPAVQALADKIIKENKSQGEEALEADVLKNARDNYSARLWKQEPGEVPADAVGKFRTTTARAKARTLESILHGWSLGKKLQITGAIGAQQIAARQISQAIHDRRMIKAAVSEGLLSNKKEESDWRIIEHPNFKNWQWIGKAEEGKVYGSGLFITEDGDILQESPLYASKHAATSLDNILGTSKLPGKRLITKWNNIFKHLMLSLSLFHHQAFMRSYTFGTHGIEGFRPVKAYRDGKRAILNYEGMTRELVRGGLTIGKVQDFDEMLIKEKTVIGKVIDKVPGPAHVKNALIALRDQQIDFLFRKLGARLKVMGALHEFQRLLTKNKKKLASGEITREELARISAEMLNDDFGGLNLQRMRRNPTGQHIFQLFALAPDWTESNVRSMVKQAKAGDEGAAYRRMWSRIILRAGGATVLFQLLMAFMDDEEDFWSMYQRQWEEGNLRWLDVDVTPLAKAAGFKIGRGQRKYFSVLGHFRDPIKFIVHPVKSAKHKASILGSLVLEALTGTDWAGRGFTTTSELLGIDDKGTYKTSGKRSDGSTYEEGDPKGGQLAGKTVSWGNRGALEYSQLPSFMISQAKGVTPIQNQNLMAYLAGEMDGFDALTKSIGLMTATTHPDKEKESEYGSSFMWKTGNAEERSEQFESDLERMSWRGEPLGYHKFLTPKQVEQVETKIKEKKGGVLFEGLKPNPKPPKREEKAYQEKLKSHQEKLEARKKARGKMQDMVKTLDISHDQAQKLLVEYFRKPDKYGIPRRDEKRRLLTEKNKRTIKIGDYYDSYKKKAQALAKLYGKPNPAKAFEKFRSSPEFREWNTKWFRDQSGR